MAAHAFLVNQGDPRRGILEEIRLRPPLVKAPRHPCPIYSNTLLPGGEGQSQRKMLTKVPSGLQGHEARILSRERLGRDNLQTAKHCSGSHK